MSKYKVKFLVEVEDEDGEWTIEHDGIDDGIDSMVSSAWEILTQSDMWQYLHSITCNGEEILSPVLKQDKDNV